MLKFKKKVGPRTGGKLGFFGFSPPPHRVFLLKNGFLFGGVVCFAVCVVFLGCWVVFPPTPFFVGLCAEFRQTTKKKKNKKKNKKTKQTKKLKKKTPKKKKNSR